MCAADFFFCVCPWSLYSLLFIRSDCQQGDHPFRNTEAFLRLHANSQEWLAGTFVGWFNSIFACWAKMDNGIKLLGTSLGRLKIVEFCWELDEGTFLTVGWKILFELSMIFGKQFGKRGKCGWSL